MSTRSERKLAVYYNEIVKLVNEIESHEPADESKYLAIKNLKNHFDLYSEYFDRHIKQLSELKQTVTYRQKTLIELKCKKCVESLGFDYESDFIFALSLDEISETTSSAIDSSDSEKSNVFEIDNKKINFDLNLPSTSSCTEKNTNLPIIKSSFVKSILTMDNFDLKLANSIIPDFNGIARNVEDFIDKCEFYENQLKVADKDKFLQFLLKVKILRDVKAKLSTEATPKTFEEFKSVIINRFSSKITKEKKMEELQNLRQHNNLEDFATKLEVVCADLIKLKMQKKEESERKTIRSEVEELAVQVFTRGLKHTEIRQAMIYKEPTSLSEAIRFALEAEAKLGTTYETTINRYSTPTQNHNNNNFVRNSDQNANYSRNYNYNQNYNRNFKQDFRQRNFQPN